VDCDLDRCPLPFDYVITPAPKNDCDDGQVNQTLLYQGKYNARQRRPNQDIATCMSGDVSVVTF
jgi:hypothetical protein